MDTTPAVGTQLITIDPVQYVAAVYAPFRERLDLAKAEASQITSMDVKTKDGMALAIKHRAVFRRIRLEAEDARKERKAPILVISKLIDGRYKELETEIAEYEESFDKPIKVEEERLAYERVAAARAEQARLDAEEKARKDAEEARLAAERAEIARQQAELAEAQRAARERIEAEERAARERIEAQEKAARLEREDADRKARAEAQERQRLLDEQTAKVRAEQEERDREQRAQQEKIDAERRAIEDAQRKERERLEALAKADRDAKEAAERKKRMAAEEKARKQREAEEAKQREFMRKEAELMDGMSMLKTFVERFGKREEFAFVTDAIKKYLRIPA